MGKEYFGKYRGIVTNTNDPEGLFRIKVKVPSITGDCETGWCLPCLPFPAHEGGAILLPKVDDTVWIEFEQGNLGYPIWTGCWYAKSKKPTNSYSLKSTLMTYADTKKSEAIASSNGYTDTKDTELRNWATSSFEPK